MEPFSGKALSWRLSDRVIELAMHLPPANEMGSVLLSEFDQFLTALRSDSSQAAVMIVCSEIESAFSAGGDLRGLYVQRQNATSPYADTLARESVRQSHSRLNAMDELPLVTIAAVCGICFGSGFELALTCDLMIADKTARFAFPRCA